MAFNGYVLQCHPHEDNSLWVQVQKRDFENVYRTFVSIRSTHGLAQCTPVFQGHKAIINVPLPGTDRAKVLLKMSGERIPPTELHTGHIQKREH